MSNDTIQHHGIKGQKWGVQNGPSYPLSREQRSAEEKKKNGAISDSGKERYGKDGVSSNKDSDSHEGLKSVDASKVTDDVKKSLVKNAKDMTNSELQNAINRMNSENQLKQLLAEQNIAKPKQSNIVGKSIDLARNTTQLASSVARLGNKKDLADNLGSVSKLIGQGKSSYLGINNLRDKMYQNQINEFKSKIDLSDFSDSEIREVINRINLERTYNSLVQQGSQIDSGKARVEQILDVANVVTGLGASGVGIASEIKNMAGRSSKSEKNSSSNNSNTGGENSTKDNNKSAKNNNTDTANKQQKKEKQETSSNTNTNTNTNTNKQERKTRERANKSSSKSSKSFSSEERKVYEGTVEGEGFASSNSNRANEQRTRNGKMFYDDIINGEWHEVNESTSLVPVRITSNGEDYIKRMLPLLRG